jgi:outer membrane lipoprotein
MQKVFSRKALLLLLAVALTSCAAGISKQVRNQVTYFGPFADVQQAPQKYAGETMLWGGKVIETRVKNNTTEIVVLQLALDRWDRPQGDDQSQGRFIVRSAQFLDPALYPPGILITVAGHLQGSERRSIGEMPYAYPVIDPIEIKKWASATQPASRFHFGIGIGAHF